jgi:2-methylcitrate dehydratase PrpD
VQTVTQHEAHRSLATRLSEWAVNFLPSEADYALGRRSLLDTVAVALAARHEPVVEIAIGESEVTRWAIAAHALDYDDLHMPSTTHVSAIVIPAALALGGDVRAYLAGAGAMTRIGSVLGWEHYQRGWHATCTAGAVGAAVAAGTAMGLDEGVLAIAIALAVPGAGGVHRAFGTMAKSLQVGFAASAGVRAAKLAARGATADAYALDQWVQLVGGHPGGELASQPAISDGLAVKLYPCCYALQRPIAATTSVNTAPPSEVTRIRCWSHSSALLPLIHHRPRTGLEGKFSLEYGLAAAVLDGNVDLTSFSDEAVRRPEVRRLMGLVDVIEVSSLAEGLLAGEFRIEIESKTGISPRAKITVPPGAPANPLTDDQLRTKVENCCGALAADVMELDWQGARQLMNGLLPGSS